MLRHSRKPVSQPTKLDHPTNEAFFDHVRRDGGRAPWILLVGGRDLTSIRLRHAQSHVRYDARPSHFSHAAIVLDVPPKGDVLQATGLEVTLAPLAPQRHLPERNGVTFFRLSRYSSPRKYPNVAVIAATHAIKKREGERVAPMDVLRKAVLDDNPGRAQHAFLPWVARWRAWVLDSTAVPNPLLDNVPMPGAAFCDYAFAAAGLDVMPSASSSALTPEHLWASVKHFSDALASSLGSFRVWSVVRDERAPLPAADDTPLAAAYQAFVERA